MAIKIGINGMGRIGRMIVRSIFESQNKNLKIQHINNRSNSEATGKLIKYDSIHGKFDADIKFDENHLMINKQKIAFSLLQYSAISTILALFDHNEKMNTCVFIFSKRDFINNIFM